jgi:hypothetical protein
MRTLLNGVPELLRQCIRVYRLELRPDFSKINISTTTGHNSKFLNI